MAVRLLGMTSSVQLLLYGFDAGADFEGRLVGALERLESGGAMRIIEALFVGREAGTGELAASSCAAAAPAASWRR